jgi:glycosyl transferase family 92
MRLLKLSIFIIFCFSGTLLHAKNVQKYNLSVCATFHNESHFLKEWIEYHKLVGIDHFYLYNISSADRYMKILQPYIKKGLVTLIQWPDLSKGIQDAGVRVMCTRVPAYEHAIHVKAKHETNWLICIDINEFLVPGEEYNLKEVLEKYKESPGLALETDCYDASHLNSKKPVIESIKRSNPSCSLETSVAKIIFNPKLVDYMIWPPYTCVFKNQCSSTTIDKYVLRINQYVNRKFGSKPGSSSFTPFQIDSRRISEKELDNLLKTGCEIEDTERAIYRFIPELRKKLGISPSLD